MNTAQEIVNLIKGVAKANAISTTKMLEDCQLNKNTLSSMQSRGSMPKADNLAKIADYLDVSVDYLLGRTDSPTVVNSHNTVNGSNNIIGNGSGNRTGNVLSEQESALMDIFNRLGVVKQAKLLVLADELEKE